MIEFFKVVWGFMDPVSKGFVLFFLGVAFCAVCFLITKLTGPEDWM